MHKYSMVWYVMYCIVLYSMDSDSSLVLNELNDELMNLDCFILCT